MITRLNNVRTDRMIGAAKEISQINNALIYAQKCLEIQTKKYNAAEKVYDETKDKLSYALDKLEDAIS